MSICVAVVVSQRQDSATDPDWVYALSHFVNYTRYLVPGSAGCFARTRIDALAHKYVGKIDAGSLDGDTQLALFGNRVGCTLQPEYFRSSTKCQDDFSHICSACFLLLSC